MPNLVNFDNMAKNDESSSLNLGGGGCPMGYSLTATVRGHDDDDAVVQAGINKVEQGGITYSEYLYVSDTFGPSAQLHTTFTAGPTAERTTSTVHRAWRHRGRRAFVPSQEHASHKCGPPTGLGLNRGFKDGHENTRDSKPPKHALPLGS